MRWDFFKSSLDPPSLVGPCAAFFAFQLGFIFCYSLHLAYYNILDVHWAVYLLQIWMSLLLPVSCFVLTCFIHHPLIPKRRCILFSPVNFFDIYLWKFAVVRYCFLGIFYASLIFLPLHSNPSFCLHSLVCFQHKESLLVSGPSTGISYVDEQSCI